jgi:hypothetical protein
MLANGVEAPAEGGFTHDRQAVMVKGRAASDPTYVVFRDRMTGPGVLPSWWNINLFGRKESIKQEGSVLHCDTPWPVKPDVIFADGGPLALEMAEDEPHSDAQYFPFSEAWNRLWKDGEKLPSFWLNKEGKPAGEKKGEYRGLHHSHAVRQAGMHPCRWHACGNAIGDDHLDGGCHDSLHAGWRHPDANHRDGL